MKAVREAGHHHHHRRQNSQAVVLQCHVFDLFPLTRPSYPGESSEWGGGSYRTRGRETRMSEDKDEEDNEE